MTVVRGALTRNDVQVDRVNRGMRGAEAECSWGAPEAMLAGGMTEDERAMHASCTKARL